VERRVPGRSPAGPVLKARSTGRSLVRASRADRISDQLPYMRSLADGEKNRASATRCEVR
jgi:hypothetical protein